MRELLIYGGVALATAVGMLVFIGLQTRASQKEFGDNNPAQNRLSHIVEAHLRSAQDEAAYRTFSEAVRREFEVIGVASPERVRQRLMHASGPAVARIKQGGRKPAPAKVRGTAEAIIRLSEEI